MTAWPEFQFHELTQVPKPAKEKEDKDLRSGPLAASLSGSHADLLGSGTPSAMLLTAWVRPPQGNRVHVLLGGRPFFPPAAGVPDSGGTRAVLFPPGAVAMDWHAHGVSRLLEPFRSWVPCAARPDSLWAPDSDKRTAKARRGSFDQHVAHLRVPFVWLVIAEPLPQRELEPELRRLANEILPLSRAEVGEARRIELERKQARHRELSRAQLGGGWRLRVLVGSVDPRGASTAAAMLCAATELDGLPYVLEPAGRPAPMPDLQSGQGTQVASTDLLVALTRPPERELPGLRLVEPHGFDVTPESTGTGGLRLGSVLDEGRVIAGDLVLSGSAMNRHTFVCGATGGGKSQTVRHLLTEASRAGLPWLVVEPAKAEYARMAARVAGLGAEVIVLRPGDPDSAPAGFNPLEPIAGFPLQTHVDLLRALFLAAFDAQEPFPQILAAALTRCYEELGWDMTLGAPVHKGQTPRCPTLGDLQRVAADVVTEIGYGKEIAGNVQGFIKIRLSSLRLGTAGRFFEGGHPLDFARLCRSNVVLELEDIGDDADKAFMMGAILLRLAEHLRVTARTDPRQGLRHLTVIEEAHRLLRRAEPGAAGPAAHAVEMFAAMLAEVRAYGEGLIVAEQIPSKLTVDVIKNTAVKIVHRLPALDDRESVGATMNVDDAQSRHIVTLTPGEGAVFTDGMDRPVLVRVPDGTELEAGQGKTAPVDALIGRRSATCGTDCQARACTLRDMRAAAHLLADEPWLTLWAELTVLAHLTDEHVPVPKPVVREAFTDRGLPTRLVDCALSHAVDDAIAVRSSVLQPTVDPSALAVHVRTTLVAMLSGEASGCGRDERRYLAAPFRWELVRHALERGDGSARDPRTPLWEKEFRRRIPGNTRAEQLAAVTDWLLGDLENAAKLDAVAYGTRRPATLESLIGTVPAGRERRLTAALDQFVACAWPIKHLRTPRKDVSAS